MNRDKSKESKSASKAIERLGFMKNPYSWFLLVCILLGLGFSYYLGSQHYDLPVLDRFEAASAEEAASIVFAELLKEDPAETLPLILFIGLTPGAVEDVEFARSFLAQTNLNEKNKIDVVVVEKDLPMIELVPSQLQLDLKESAGSIAEAVKKAVATNKRIVVVAPNIYVSQLLGNNPIALIQERAGTTVTSLSLVKFPITEGQAKSFDPPCQVDAGDVRGTGPLGCAILQKSRILWRNLPAPEKYWGRLEKVGPKDFLLLLNRH